MTTLLQLSELTRQYAEIRAKLSDQIGALELEVQALRRRSLPGIRRTLATAQERRDALVNALNEARDLFKSPKTQVFHGVRVGFQKGKGALVWADDATVVKLIKKHMAEKADELLKTTEKPIKSALANLSATDLKRLGVEVVDATDETVVRPLDSELDKLVDRLLEDTAEIPS